MIQRAAGKIFVSLAERRERAREDELDENAFADAKNDAVELLPLYEHLRAQAVSIFGKGILSFSASIADADHAYRL